MRDGCCEACGRAFATPEVHGLKFDGPLGMYRTEPDAWKTIKFTQCEAVIVRALLDCFGEHLHRERLFIRVWGTNSEVQPKIIDVMMCKVRKKLEGSPYEIRSQWGFGYGLFLRADSVGNVGQTIQQHSTTENASAYSA